VKKFDYKYTANGTSEHNTKKKQASRDPERAVNQKKTTHNKQSIGLDTLKQFINNINLQNRVASTRPSFGEVRNRSKVDRRASIKPSERQWSWIL
jgi:hypothetical protein